MPDNVNLWVLARAAHGDHEHVVIGQVGQAQGQQAGPRDAQCHVYCIPSSCVHLPPCSQMDSCNQLSLSSSTLYFTLTTLQAGLCIHLRDLQDTLVGAVQASRVTFALLRVQAHHNVHAFGHDQAIL